MFGKNAFGKNSLGIMSYMWTVYFKVRCIKWNVMSRLKTPINVEWEATPLYELLEMRPDQIRAYFWPVVNKRPTSLCPGYFLINKAKKIFFDPKGKNLKNLLFLQNFPIPKPKMDDPINKKIDPTRVKKF